MKSLLKSLVLFIPTAFAIYMVLLFVSATTLPIRFQKNLQYWKDHSDFTPARLEESKSLTDIDILFVGSSRVYAGIDPRIFEKKGLNIFALGTSRQTPIVAEHILDRHLIKMKPDHIVFELSPGSFRSDYQNEMASIITQDEINYDSWEHALRINNMIIYNTLFLTTIRRIMGITEQTVTSLSDHNYISGGYIQRENRYFSGREIKANTKSISDEQIESVNRLVKRFEDEKIKCTFIQIPTSKSLYESVLNRGAFDSLISTFGTFQNFNAEVELVDTIHFEDGSHLNQLGVNVFNPVLIEYLSDSTVWNKR